MDNIALAIYLALKDASKQEQPGALRKVVEFLYKKRLISRKDEILERLKKIINYHEKKLEVKVSSAAPLEDSVNKELAENLTRRYGAKSIDLIENIDPTLLGGFKIEVGDEVIDLSIKNKVNKLQEYLIKSA